MTAPRPTNLKALRDSGWKGRVVTAYRPEEDNAFSFFKRADENLLNAKRTGKDRVVAE